MADPQGPAGGALNYADFYALIPPDNAAAVAPGTGVSFPPDGTNSESDISRTGPDSFNPAQIGAYQTEILPAMQLRVPLHRLQELHSLRQSQALSYSDAHLLFLKTHADPISFIDGKKIDSGYTNYYSLRETSDEICRKYGLSVIKNPKGHTPRNINTQPKSSDPQAKAPARKDDRAR